MTPPSARLFTANRVLLSRTPHGARLKFQQPGAARMMPWDAFAGRNLSRLVLDPDTLSAMTPWLDILEKDVNALRYGQPPLLPLLAYAQHAPDFVLMPLLHQRIVNLQRNGRVLALGKRFFPDTAHLFFPEKSWNRNFMVLLDQIEAQNWFRIDWDLIELARVLDEEDMAHDVTGNGLAKYLWEIPVMCYAPTATEASGNPAVAWLRALLCGEWESLTFGKLADVGIDPTRLPDSTRIRHAVSTTVFRQYSSPLASIPVVARVIWPGLQVSFPTAN